MQPQFESPRQTPRVQPPVGEPTVESAVPLFFGTAGRPLSGWYHAAGARPVPRPGVVICAPFGYEMMRTYRACRHLAQQLAASGVPAIRFDYDGTGDSAGSDHDPDRVQAWTASIGLAVDELKARSGVSDVVLFGIRFGALLAAEYARRHPVRALVLLAPVVSGRAFARELRAVAAMNGGDATDPADDGEVLGYHLSSTTRADLGRLDLTTAEGRPAAHALIIAREDLPGAERALAQTLERAGVAVTSTVTRAFAGMVVDPHKAVVPFQLWDDIVQWIHHVPLPQHAGAAVAAPGTGAPAQLAIVDTGHGLVRETFLAEAGIFGVLSRPADDQPSNTGTVTPFRAALPTILLLNIGMNHHVGSHRLWVTTARAWAARGYQVLRLDVSGIGDSAADDMAAERALYSGQATEDLRRIMDVLGKTYGTKRFLLCGLCAGAYMAYHTAAADPRIVGVVLINLRTFEWRAGDSLEDQQRNTFKSTGFYRRAALEPGTWIRFVRGNVHARVLTTELVRRLSARVRSAWSGWGRQSPDSGVLGTMRMLCRRGTSVLMIFGADEVGIDVMEEQLGGGASRMKGESLFRVAIVPGADHTFTGRAARTQLMSLLDDHLRRLRT